ncbi:MAG: acetyl-CoA C-acetyltransferase [Anaerolineales bacterium]|nr:acetyl-CoA C-acetyltransferase [Anaerolineales bacterium]
MPSEQDLQPVLLSAVRTPIGTFLGGLKSIPAQHLGALVIAEAVRRAGITNPADIDEVLMGCVISAGLGQNPARQAAIFSGLPSSVGAFTINKVCGSGLKAVTLAAQAVKAGDGKLFVCGGMENMSRAPYLLHGRSGELRYGHTELKDALLVDGLWDVYEDWHMGNAAEFIGEDCKVTREEMDAFSLQSHIKAVAAIDNGAFKEEILPVEVAGRKGQVTVVDTDEGPRRDTSLEALSRLRPVFKPDGCVTAGNASSLNDGAAALVTSSAAWAEEQGLKPMARIAGYSQAAVDPKYIFIAPARAIPPLLEKVGWSLKDVDLIELNEAFAAQMLADGCELEPAGWDWDKVNVNGGALAMGHPIGASGARILTTLLYALKNRGLKRGIAAICLGGAEAVAVAVEMII